MPVHSYPSHRCVFPAGPACVSVAMAGVVTGWSVRTSLAATLVSLGDGVTLTVGAVVLAGALGAWVYVDARSRYGADLAALAAVAIGGLLIAGSLPGLVALAVADDAAVQGFPTALRIVPGLVALGVYLYARRV